MDKHSIQESRYKEIKPVTFQIMDVDIRSHDAVTTQCNRWTEAYRKMEVVGNSWEA